ncbi:MULTISPECIES: hypothetical protein [Pseudomonas]|uniref:DUF2335 domain-containing protein n=1 Tax=Pseudomonas aphyarum TaxID=2942629 RepID=A0ABT5PNM3_9PSED|nr:hypothetical protein [Pseudomonas aphyarum]MDD0971915.1 hypothetical protein [Pseudomonas aphyarum]MDD1125514.1 hypothetical protein [Pseudomonas aphyarum]
MELPVGAPPPAEDDNGVSGEQQPGSSGNVAPTPPPLEGDLLPRTFMGVITGNPETFGGPQMAAVMAAMISDASYDKAQARLSVDAIQAKLDSANAEISDWKEKYGRLEERLDSASTLGTIKKSCTFFGTIAVGFAIELYKSHYTISVLLGLCGLGMLSINLVRGKRS